MDLKEKIARAIRPDVTWDQPPSEQTIEWIIWSVQDEKRKRILRAADRVIATLGLSETHDSTGNTAAARYRTKWFDREPRIRQLYEEDM